MSELATTARPVGIVVKTTRRVAVAVTIAIGVALLLLTLYSSSTSVLLLRAITIGLAATAVFSLFEVWPRRLPRGIERWILQVVAVGVAMPFTVLVMHRLTTPEGARPFFQDHDWMLIWVSAVLVAPWTAVATVVRQKEAVARAQKLTFALERSELERQALDARLHLLQAQVAPHFLFNTLANVQALVDAGSPQASSVLKSLIAYLRAAVPRMKQVGTALGQELDLVRAYLELMQMRIPDRLKFALHIEPEANSLQCPPMTLLTL
ncbi:MAG: sensor histidine kinase, partial [Vicinamibacterales bacterium]